MRDSAAAATLEFKMIDAESASDPKDLMIVLLGQAATQEARVLPL